MAVRHSLEGCCGREQPRPAGVKMPDFAPYDTAVGSYQVMLRRVILVFSLVAFGLALSGCTKCGPIWDDWMQSPKSCKSDHF
jgi:hypothetical protein